MKLPEPFFFEESNRAVILFHAYTGSSNDVRMLGRVLQRAGYTVYAPHLSGHATGKLTDLVYPTSAEDWVKDGDKVYEFLLDKGYKQIVPLGLSLGGAVAAHVALNHKVLGAGSFCTPIIENDIYETNVPRIFLTYAQQYYKRLGLTSAQMTAKKQYLEQQLSPTIKSINQMNATIRQHLSELQIPYYIAEAGQDSYINAHSGEKLKIALKNAQVDYHYFPESDHVITVGSAHKVFEQTVLTFLSLLDWK